MASVTYKIRIAATKTSKTMAFSPTITVAEMIKQITAKTGAATGPDFGLCVAVGEGGAFRWLKNKRRVEDCELRHDDEVVYKKKVRPLKVTLEDGTNKMVLVDESLPVEEVVGVIGKKMGLKNPEEFSLQKESNEQWLNMPASLAEQGMGPDDAVMLKKKFFVHDAQIDRSDPVQLHLVYSQSLNSILRGDHPLAAQECANLAALQCQIVHGNYSAQKTGKGFLAKEKKKLLPPQFHAKLGTIEPLLIEEYKKLVGMTEVNAKFRYVTDCRKLKTYGITTYSVKQKLNNSKKMVPRFLGITRDAVVLMDGATREVVQEFPLTHVRRWAAAAKTFTLDFGDYEDDYMSLQTDEAETISQLIAGYIDILLKKRKEGAALVDFDDGTKATVEEVSGARALPVGGVAVVGRAGKGAGGKAGAGAGGAGQGFTYVNGKAGQQIEVTQLADASAAIRQMIQDAATKSGHAGQMSYDEYRKHLVEAAEAAGKHSADLKGLIDSAEPGQVPYGGIDATSSKLATDIGQLLNAAKGMSAQGNQELLNMARSLADAVAGMLDAAQKVSSSPSDAASRLAYEAARQAFEAEVAAVAAAAKGVAVDDADQRILLAAASAVSAATEEMVRSAKMAHNSATDVAGKKRLQEATQSTTSASAALINTANILSPTIIDPTCQSTLLDAGKRLKTHNGELLAAAAQAGLPDRERKALVASAKAINDAIIEMMKAAKAAESQARGEAELREAAKRYLNAATNVAEKANADAKQLIPATKQLAEAQQVVMAQAKAKAVSSHPAERARLLAAAKAVGAATANVVEAAKAAAKSPSDKTAGALRDTVAKAMEEARALVRDTGAGGKAHLLASELLNAAQAKYAAAAAIQMNASLVSSKARTGNAEKDQAMLEAARRTAEAMSKLLDVVRATDRSAKDAFDKLSAAAAQSVAVAFPAVATVKKSVPLMKDNAAKNAVNGSSTDMQHAVGRLNEAAKKERGEGAEDFDDAFGILRANEADLKDATTKAADGQLRAAPGQTQSTAISMLQGGARQLAGASMTLAKASQASERPKVLAAEAKKAAQTAGQAVHAAVAVASGVSGDRDVQKAVLERAAALNDATQRMAQAAQAVAEHPQDKHHKVQLAKAAKETASGAAELSKLARDTETGAVDGAVAAVARAKEALGASAAEASGAGDFKAIASQLVTTAKAVDSAGKALHGATAKDKRLQEAPAAAIAAKVPMLATAAKAAMAAATDQATAQKIFDDTDKLLDATGSMLAAAKAASASDKSSLDSLLRAAQQLSRYVQDLSPEERVIADAMQLFEDQTSKIGARGGTAAAANVTYQAATASLIAAAKDLLGAMSKLSSAAKASAKDMPAAFKRVADVTPKFVEANDAAGATAPEAVKKEFDAACKAVGERGLMFMTQAKAVYDAPKSQQAHTALVGDYKNTATAVKSLIQAVEKGATGDRAVDAAQATIERLAQELASGVFYVDAALAAKLTTPAALKQEAAKAAAAVAAAVQAFSALKVGDQAALGNGAQAASTAIVDLVTAVKTLLKSPACADESKAAQKATLEGTLAVLKAAGGALRCGQAYHGGQSAQKDKMTAATEQVAVRVETLTAALSDADDGEGGAAAAALSDAQAELRAALDSFASSDAQGAADVQADDVVDAARAVAQEAAFIVTASKGSSADNGEQMLTAASGVAAAGQGLLDTARGAAKLAPDDKTRVAVDKSSTDTIRALIQLLGAAKAATRKNVTAAQQSAVSVAAASVVQRVNDVSAAADKLPRQKVAVESNDNLEDLAEQELAACAKAIEAAASMLLAKPKRAQNVSLDAFDEVSDAIIDSAQAIAMATQKLVIEATKAQREITASGAATGKNFYKADPAWAKGLISAAQSVAGAVKLLVAASNKAAQKDKDASEAELIATARQVSAATVRLVAAARAKLNPASQTQSSLQGAASGVTRATSELVEHAKVFAEVTEEEEITDDSKLGAVARMKKQREEEEEIMRIEQELLRAEKEYLALNQKSYQK